MSNAYSPDYDAIVSEVQDITENDNDEFVLNIPKFIQRAQDQVQRDLSLSIWRTYQTATPITTAAYTRPADALIVLSVYLPASNTFVLKRHLDYVRMYGGSTGRPKVWAEDQETTLLFAPAPDTSYAARFEIYERLAALSEANPTNWLTANAADLLLLQVLINAHHYLVNPEKEASCGALYGALLQSAIPELRDSERHRSMPIRQAPRPNLSSAGGNG